MYAKQAIDRGIYFALSEDEFSNLLLDDCFYCGSSPAQTVRVGNHEIPDFWYNGIDRVECSSGYIPENVVTCCGMCNRAKRDASQDEFFEYLDRVAAFRNKKQAETPGVKNVRGDKQDSNRNKQGY